MKWRFKCGWVLVASLVAATAVAPLGASPAAADSSTVLVTEQTHTTSSPACTFTLRVTETLSGGSVTGLHNRASFSCAGLGDGNRYLGTAIQDAHMHSAGINSAGQTYTGLGLEVAFLWHKIVNTDSAAVENLDYNNVKATHPYISRFSFGVYLPDGVTGDQNQDCTQYDYGWWDCEFDSQTTPASALPVGPDPLPGPVTRSLTVPYDTSGGTCQLITELRATDPTTLSYTGRTVCPPTSAIASGGGDIFIYGDRREATLLRAADEQCYQCPDMRISGQIPAVKGRTYTATFYTLINVVGPPPPECSGDSETGYVCEVSASIVF